MSAMTLGRNSFWWFDLPRAERTPDPRAKSARPTGGWPLGVTVESASARYLMDNGSGLLVRPTLTMAMDQTTRRVLAARLGGA
ncbi:hypothetical protein [uncultured Thiodictyon sp.]|uniref:hypothetical protein n=1 Tax=uncultured Thiodictyon sp. TaxID=1846217 RepID=UPI0025E53A54|nr:hypothetical protein [uncultured Thiodictyon sp.]